MCLCVHTGAGHPSHVEAQRSVRELLPPGVRKALGETAGQWVLVPSEVIIWADKIRSKNMIISKGLMAGGIWV